jgi:hypothetical protein
VDDIIQVLLSQQWCSLEEQAAAYVESQSLLLLAWPASSFDSMSLSAMFVGGFGTGNCAL